MEQTSPRKPRVSKPSSTASTRTGQSHSNASSSSTATKPTRRRETESADASSTRGNTPRPQKQQTAVSKIDGEDYDVIPSKSVDTLQSDKKTQERVAPSKVLKPKEHHKDYHTFIKYWEEREKGKNIKFIVEHKDRAKIISVYTVDKDGNKMQRSTVPSKSIPADGKIDAVKGRELDEWVRSYTGSLW